MNYKLITRLRMRLTLLASGFVLWANTGGTFGDAVIDGFFGAISATVVSLISPLILTGTGG